MLAVTLTHYYNDLSGGKIHGLLTSPAPIEDASKESYATVNIIVIVTDEVAVPSEKHLDADAHISGVAEHAYYYVDTDNDDVSVEQMSTSVIERNIDVSPLLEIKYQGRTLYLYFSLGGYTQVGGEQMDEILRGITPDGIEPIYLSEGAIRVPEHQIVKQCITRQTRTGCLQTIATLLL